MKKNHLLLFILIATLIMGIGYANVNNINFSISGIARAKDKGKVAITNVVLSSQSNNFTSIANPPDYTDTSIDFSMSLEIKRDRDAQNSYFAVYTVTVSNTSFYDYVFSSDLFNPHIDPSYPNGGNLEYTYDIDGLKAGDTIEADSTKQFTITITLYPTTTKGTYGINITTNVNVEESNEGLLVGSISSEETADLTGSNTIAKFTAEVMNTHQREKTFNFNLNKENFTITDANGNSLNNFVIAGNTTKNFDFYIKRNDNAKFLKSPQTMNVYLNNIDDELLSSIGTVSINVDISEDIIDNQAPVINTLDITRQKNARNLTANWNATDNIGIDKFMIELYDSSNTVIKSAELTGDTTTYTFSELADGSYHVKLTVFDQNENSSSKTTDPLSCTWTYTVKVTCTNCSSTPSSATVEPNGSFSSTFSGTGNYSTPNSVSVQMDGTSTSQYTYNASSGNFSIENITGDVTITASGYNVPCLIEGTKVLMADGTTKNVEDIDYDDLIMVYSHETGEFIPEYPIWIESGKPTSQYQLTTFSDGTTLKTVGPHTVFGIKENQFIDVADRNHFDIGTEIFKIEPSGNTYKLKKVSVTNIETINEDVYYYDIVSTRYYNAITDYVLTSDGRPELPNFYQFKENALWSDRRLEVLENNIQTPYEKLSYIPYYLFKGLRATDQAVLEHYGYLNASDFRKLFEMLLMNPYMQKEPMKNKNGNRVWMVTTSLDQVTDENKHNFLYEEGVQYKLPKTNGKWFSTSENKYYNSNETVQIWHGMHFIEINS